MVRTQISMTEEQAEGLRRLAAQTKRSQSALLRDALNELLTGSDRSRRIGAARSVIGRHGSGRSDTSEEHDAALDDAFST